MATQPGTNARKEYEGAKALSSFMIRFYADQEENALYVTTPKTGPNKCYTFVLSCRNSLNHRDLMLWWNDDDERGYSVDDLDGRGVEILPPNEEKTMSRQTLQDLFDNDFCVEVGFDEDKTCKVVDLFKVARDLGVKYQLDEVFEGTWMEDEVEADFSPDNWKYFGIISERTFITDNRFEPCLSVEEFEKLVEQEQQVAKVSPGSPLTQAIPEKNVIILGDNISLSGGVVVINYKNGKKFHLHHNGKATFDVQSRTVTTERTFVKDGQQALERVVIELDNLESVQSDTNKLINVGNNQVAFVTLFTL